MYSIPLKSRSNRQITIWLLIVCLSIIAIARTLAPAMRTLSTDRIQCISDGTTMHCVLRQLTLPHGLVEPRAAPRQPTAGEA